MPDPKPKKSDEKSETLKEEVSKFKVGDIYGDVKIVELKPNFERSILFVQVQREKDRQGNMVEVRNSQGKLIWQNNVRSMNEEDFIRFIRGQQECCQLPEAEYLEG
ncbi:MAG: hypothetical protein ACOZAL_03440 [Patescibacteria group bacterium]